MHYAPIVGFGGHREVVSGSGEWTLPDLPPRLLSSGFDSARLLCGMVHLRPANAEVHVEQPPCSISCRGSASNRLAGDRPRLYAGDITPEGVYDRSRRLFTLSSSAWISSKSSSNF